MNPREPEQALFPDGVDVGDNTVSETNADDDETAATSPSKRSMKDDEDAQSHFGTVGLKSGSKPQPAAHRHRSASTWAEMGTTEIFSVFRDKVMHALDEELLNALPVAKTQLSKIPLSRSENIIADEMLKQLANPKTGFDFKRFFVTQRDQGLIRTWFVEDIAHKLNAGVSGKSLKANVIERMHSQCLSLLPDSLRARVTGPLMEGLRLALGQGQELVSLLFKVSRYNHVRMDRSIFTYVIRYQSHVY